MDPRFRERRIEVARIEGRRRRRLLLVLAGLVALAVGVLWVLHGPLLTARHVQVVGARHTPRSEIVARAGLRGAPPLVDVSPGAAAARLRQLPWIATATVTRHWPDSVTVAVTERRPVASVARPGGTALVDATGRVLSWGPWGGGPLPDLVTTAVPGHPGSVLAAAAHPGLVVAAALPPVLVGRVAAVDVGPHQTVTLDLGGGVTALLGDGSDLTAKFEAVASVLAGAPPSGAAVIDVTDPQAPAVGPPAASAAPAAPAPTGSAPTGAGTTGAGATGTQGTAPTATSGQAGAAVPPA